MRFTLRRTGGLSWAARVAVAATLVTGSAAATAGIAAAAQAGTHTASKAAVVVNEARRTGFGKILVTVNGGMSLYVHPGGACTGPCLSVWPPLLMPKGKTMPKGATCLGTVAFGHKHQVTYQKLPLFTFTGDTGHSVSGNGVGGFVVAKVMKCTGGSTK